MLYSRDVYIFTSQRLISRSGSTHPSSVCALTSTTFPPRVTSHQAATPSPSLPRANQYSPGPSFSGLTLYWVWDEVVAPPNSTVRAIAVLMKVAGGAARVIGRRRREKRRERGLSGVIVVESEVWTMEMDQRVRWTRGIRGERMIIHVICLFVTGL